MEKLEEDMKPKLIGKTFRKHSTETSMQKSTYGLFQCQYCGKEFECIVQSISSGNTKSCGCLQGQNHGLAAHRFYKTWCNMIQRCTNPNHKAYKNYGGRDITVCEEWLDIANFVAWCDVTYPNIEGYTLDRIDNDKGYSPDNCRWADRSTQGTNQRMKSNNTSGYIGIFWDKDSKKWAAKIGVNNKLVNIGRFPLIEEAIQARDNYIIENNLPHKLSTEYIKDK